jgi:hypothetical protein
LFQRLSFFWSQIRPHERRALCLFYLKKTPVTGMSGTGYQRINTHTLENCFLPGQKNSPPAMLF